MPSTKARAAKRQTRELNAKTERYRAELARQERAKQFAESCKVGKAGKLATYKLPLRNRGRLIAHSYALLYLSSLGPIAWVLAGGHRIVYVSLAE